jgi:hypothetical protein
MYEGWYRDDRDDRYDSNALRCIVKSSRCCIGVLPGGTVGDLYTELTYIFLPWMTVSIVIHSKVLGIKADKSSMTFYASPVLI